MQAPAPLKRASWRKTDHGRYPTGHHSSRGWHRWLPYRLSAGQTGARVTILERDSVASHASGFAFGEMGALEGAGIPDPLLEFSLWCSRRHPTLAEELKEVSGNDSQFRLCNRLTLAFDQQAVDHAQQSLRWQTEGPPHTLHENRSMFRLASQDAFARSAIGNRPHRPAYQRLKASNESRISSQSTSPVK